MNTSQMYFGIAGALVMWLYTISVCVVALVYVYDGQDATCLKYVEVGAWVFLVLAGVSLLGALLAIPLLLRFARMHLTYNDIIALHL